MIRRKGRPGYWYQRDINKKRVRRYLGADYEEAKRQLEQLRREEKPGVTPAGLVSSAAEEWLQTYVPTRRNEKGQKLARRRVEKYLVPCLGYLRVTRVQPDDLRDYSLWLEKQKISKQTVAHVLSDARCLLLWCEEKGWLDRSPFPRRLMPRVDERPPDRISDEEADLLRVLPDPHGFVCRLALGTGLRWGELTRAQRSDVKNGMLEVHRTKSGKLRRVPLSPELLGEIHGRVGRLVPFAEKACGSFAQVIRRRTGMTGFHVHQLRHTFACQWLEHGGSLASLQEILGHASIVTTQRYGRMSERAVRREAELVRLNACRTDTNGGHQDLERRIMEAPKVLRRMNVAP